MSFKIHHSALDNDLIALDNQVCPDDSPLPTTSSKTHLIIAPKGSGKSSLLLNLLKSKNAYNKKFDNIWLFSPTCRGDSKFSDLINELEPEGKVYDELTNENLQKVLNELQNFNENFDVKKKKRQPLSLIVFDDNYHQLLKKGKEAIVLNKLITQARHYKTSLVFLIQRFKVSPLLRCNSDLISIFRINNKQELKDILDEWSISPELYNFCTKDEYSFLHISYATSPPKYFKKFSPITFENQ